MVSGSTKHKSHYKFMHVLCTTFLFEPFVFLTAFLQLDK